MSLIYSAKHLIHYGQVGIWGHEDTTAYPMPDGPLPWWGPKGLAVAAQSGGWITVDIHSCDHLSDAPADTPKYMIDGHITVGSRGLVAGNITAASTHFVKWPAGRISVAAYFAGRVPVVAHRVAFVLSKA